MEIRDVVIVAAVRSAVARGKKDGSLAATHPIDLSAAVMKDAVGRLANTGFTAAMLDDVLWGCAMPEGSQGLNHARLAVLRAGMNAIGAPPFVNDIEMGVILLAVAIIDGPYLVRYLPAWARPGI